ncbi:semaphorin-1A-like [Neocloeon triangulifer]|uniref:semaphorin-1A-like n=1 Tax=Neocloeon triangulifer TaxID=2078957 RepID=UPI00286F7162|nr:semaphorin-1A-like [Neocloeon triangulifer]
MIAQDGVLFVLLAVCGLSWASLQGNIRPKTYVDLGAEDVYQFNGNDTHTDFFRLVLHDGPNLLVGGRNFLHILNLTDLTETQRLTWFSSDSDKFMCKLKGKDEESCQNYIRVLTKISPGRYLVCGTNAFKPICREYSLQTSGFLMEKETSGQGICPYNPKSNNTAVFTNGELYSGTFADFAEVDSLIFRQPFRTRQFDSNTLKNPNFVSSFAHGDYVYFFFREVAIENINDKESIYSRVARVCKSDRGGFRYIRGCRHCWTSFLKTRLNCSVPGDLPIYFDQIQSTSDLIEGSYGGLNGQIIYAVFTASTNSTGGSAVCAFNMQDISEAFEGTFKEERDSNWLPVDNSKVPDPRPGRCVNDSRTLPESTLSFIETHSLMAESVKSVFRQPIVTRTSSQFVQIAVDPQVKTPEGKSHDVLFIGTDNGKIIKKAVNAESAENPKKLDLVIIEEIQVFPPSVAIRNLKVVRDDSVAEGRLIVISDSEIKSIKLHRCNSDKITSCSECVALQDPYCAWDNQGHKCISMKSAAQWSDNKNFLQSIASGVHSLCQKI